MQADIADKKDPDQNMHILMLICTHMSQAKFLNVATDLSKI